MSTLSVIKWSCDTVQKGKSVSTCAFSLNGHCSFHTISAQKNNAYESQFRPKINQHAINKIL